MTRKRRVFDIDMPDDTVVVSNPATQKQRRSPMASAIAENAEALHARKSVADAIREENDALAHEFVALKQAGHVVDAIPLDQVHTAMLVRDRMQGEDEELAELATSIRDLGLSNPIRVLPRPDGTGYELVQGYRRLNAYRRLLKETGDGNWVAIPALILPGGENVAELYRRMVDENMIRKDLSFAEMAHAARNYAADPATEANDMSSAVAALFQSAPYSKRSYIRSFAYLLERLERLLNYPTEIPRALGVALARAIKEQPGIPDQIGDALADWDDRTIEDEMGILRQYAFVDEPQLQELPKAAKIKKTRAGQGARTKTTFLIQSIAGQVKCTAAQGRLEIKVDRDFSAIERVRLENAVASLIDGLG